ncbi:MAG: hypothetical protein FJ020_00425 [Chloroflexi bacterium]|nr:hypothetical protein [Chloroflexota bacterium]
MYEAKDSGMKKDWKLPLVIGAAVLLMVIGALVFAWQLGWLPFEDLFSKETNPVEIAIGGETPVTGEVVSREYRWNYDNRPWTLTLQIPKDLHMYYRGMERAQTQDYSVYATHPRDDDFVRSLADRLSSEALKRSFNAQEKAGFAAAFVQSIPYREEEEEYPRYPVETLVDRGGDCEDTAILAAAVLQAMGYDVVLLNFSAVTAGGAGHMAAGVALPAIAGGYSYRFEGEDYYYLETTSPSDIGDIPAEYRTRTPEILEVVPKPVLRLSRFEWTVVTRWLREDKLVLEVEVTNWGTVDATGVTVRAFFEGHEAGAATSDAFDLDYGYKISPVPVGDIVIPSGDGTLCVELIDNGAVVDEWSEAL